MKRVESAANDWEELDGESLYEVFQSFIWLAPVTQVPIRTAQANDKHFPATLDELIALFRKGRWPIPIDVDQAVRAMTSATKPRPSKYRRKLVSDGTGWMGADIVTTRKVRRGRAGKPEKPDTTKAALTILFTRYNALLALLGSGRLEATGRPQSGNREKISASDWNTQGARLFVAPLQNDLLQRRKTGSEVVYSGIELVSIGQSQAQRNKPGPKEKYPWLTAIERFREQHKHVPFTGKRKADLARAIIDCMEEMGCDELPEQRQVERYLRDHQKEFVSEFFPD
ncbi:hypothetical protein [Roseibium polysiphoniae]|uniref:hypothetical protein n=1 Tax=Roseibium polysiphoniae TaxID=2571221 RepID=UPI0032994BDE